MSAILEAALKQIVAKRDEWNANRLGNVELQRKRWQKLGRIASEALWRDDVERASNRKAHGAPRQLT